MTQAPRVRVCDGDPRRANGITASGYVPHQQVGHMAAPTSNAKRMFKLANGGPSTHGSGRLKRSLFPLAGLRVQIGLEEGRGSIRVRHGKRLGIAALPLGIAINSGTFHEHLAAFVLSTLQ